MTGPTAGVAVGVSVGTGAPVGSGVGIGVKKRGPGVAVGEAVTLDNSALFRGEHATSIELVNNSLKNARLFTVFAAIRLTWKKCPTPGS